MINQNLPPKKRLLERKGSLYLGLLKNIIVGISVAVTAYFFIRIAAYYFITNNYLSPDKQQKRRDGYINALQDYATAEELSSEDTVKLAAWARENPYVYLLIYKDDQLFFTSDMEPEIPPSGSPSGDENSSEGSSDESGADDENTEGEGNFGENGEEEGDRGNEGSDSGNGGGHIDFGNLGFGGSDDAKQDRDQLIAEAEANGFHTIEVADGTLIAALTEFSQELYYDIANIVAFASAAISLAVVLLVYMSKVIAKIKRLETDITVVSHVDMNHEIVCEGNDELSRLSVNVETMRNSILDNLRKEREARAANTELVTSISHDIRTPLTVLLGYIDMMKSRAESDEVMKGYIAASESTAMRLKQLSDDMFKYALTFGETEKGIILEEFDGATLITQLFDEHILLLSESGYDVRISPPSGTVLSDGEIILTDAQNLMRIVDNVFSNVYKYADKSAPIEIRTFKDGDSVVFSCENKILDCPVGAESNGIGLKTCARLASFVAQSFGTERNGDRFKVTLALKLKDGI